MTAVQAQRVEACRLEEIPPGEVVTLDVDPPVALFHTEDGDLYAVDDICTHAYTLLSEGDVEDGAVECPLHMAKFDLASGRPLCFPATKALRTHRVEVSDGVVVVHVGEPAAGAHQ